MELTLAASSALPTDADAASLKATVASTLGVAEGAVKNFVVTAAPARRALLSSFTWSAAFDVVADLADAGAGATPASLAASIATDLGGSVFEAAVAAAVDAVDTVAAVTAAPSTRNPTALPSLRPTTLPSPIPSLRPSPHPSLRPSSAAAAAAAPAAATDDGGGSGVSSGGSSTESASSSLVVVFALLGAAALGAMALAASQYRRRSKEGEEGVEDGGLLAGDLIGVSGGQHLELPPLAHAPAKAVGPGGGLGGGVGALASRFSGLEGGASLDGNVAAEPFIEPPAPAAARALTLEELFDLIDANGDGELDRGEVVAACGKLSLTPEAAGKLFDDLDADGDGTLTRAEFGGGFSAFFTGGKLPDVTALGAGALGGVAALGGGAGSVAKRLSVGALGLFSGGGDGVSGAPQDSPSGSEIGSRL